MILSPSCLHLKNIYFRNVQNLTIFWEDSNKEVAVLGQGKVVVTTFKIRNRISITFLLSSFLLDDEIVCCFIVFGDLTIWLYCIAKRILVGTPSFNPFLVRIIKVWFWLREVFDFCGWKLACIMQVGSTYKKLTQWCTINVDKHSH